MRVNRKFALISQHWERSERSITISPHFYILTLFFLWENSDNKPLYPAACSSSPSRQKNMDDGWNVNWQGKIKVFTKLSQRHNIHHKQHADDPKIKLSNFMAFYQRVMLLIPRITVL